MWNWNLYGAGIGASRVYMISMFSLWIFFVVAMFSMGGCSSQDCVTETETIQAKVVSHSEERRTCPQHGYCGGKKEWQVPVTVLMDNEGNTYKKEHHLGKLGETLPVVKETQRCWERQPADKR